MRRSDEDLKAEIESHIALETDCLVGEGMSPAAARDAAHGRFGRVIAVQERYYSRDASYGSITCNGMWDTPFAHSCARRCSR